MIPAEISGREKSTHARINTTVTNLSYVLYKSKTK